MGNGRLMNCTTPLRIVIMSVQNEAHMGGHYALQLSGGR